jgi:hypothetical protein
MLAYIWFVRIQSCFSFEEYFIDSEVDNSNAITGGKFFDYGRLCYCQLHLQESYTDS